ncbi:MAG: termination factor Rho [Gammaproteobacteria bacterium]|nr:MAG: termination factor Rho [Gammaproteobacteria bacterium]
MARGDKDKYSDEQKRKAKHIENGYEHKGVSKDEAEKRAWATVNKQSGGGEHGGSGEHTSEKTNKAARKDSAHKAVASKHGISRERSGSEETKASLLEKARAKNIVGRSTMSKQQLINALHHG